MRTWKYVTFFLVSLALITLIHIFSSARQYFDLNVRLDRSVAIAQPPDPIELRSQGQSLALQRRCDEAIPLLGQALELYRAENNNPETSDLRRDGNLISEVSIFTHLSWCSLQVENYGELLTSLRAGLETRNQLTNRDYLSAGAQAGLGQLADWIDTWRGRLATDTERINALDESRAFFDDLTWVLAELGDTEGALVASEKGRARAIADILFAHSLETSAEQPNIAPSPNLDEIRLVAQEHDATLIEYAIVSTEAHPEDRLYIWVITPAGEIHFVERSLSENNQSLQSLIQQSRMALGARLRGGFENVEAESQLITVQRETLQALHHLLIHPIQAWLPEDETSPIVLIPQDNLFLVPFAALLDENSQPLIAHFPLLTAPSIQVLSLARQQRARLNHSETITGDEVLLVGNPTMPDSLRQLPGAEAEVEAIAPFYNTQFLTGQVASETEVKRRLPHARIIHLATHGFLENESLDGMQEIPGAIALAADDQNDGLLTSAEILQMQLTAELVILSACDTGLGEITGDGVIGLSRSFLQAGTPSVIVSLWAVPDAPTASLMIEFYRQWQQEGLDKAQALQKAMLLTMENHPDPAGWAAFTLIGEAE